MARASRSLQALTSGSPSRGIEFASSFGSQPGTGPSPFGIELYEAIADAGLAPKDFARRVGVSTGYLSNVFIGRRRPPLDRIKAWAGALKMDGKSAKKFVFIAYVMHCPDEIRAMVIEAYRQLERPTRAASAHRRWARLLDRFAP